MGALKDWYTGVRDELIWIDYADYATEIIGGGAPWENATAIASLLGQAQGLLSSDVISIDAGRILLGTEMSSADDPLTNLLEKIGDPARIALLSETVDALAHGVGADLVLQLPGLKKALSLCGADDDAAGDFGNLDDAGAAYTDVIRGLADKPLAGLLFGLDEACSADEQDAFGPVTSAAVHYDWLVSSELGVKGSDAGEAIENPIGHIVLLPEASKALSIADESIKIGGGLSVDFWQGGAAPGSFNLLYGRIPGGAVPETVLAQRNSINTATQ